ncbi:MAG: hypothetical protein LBG46_05925 [Elusimicrobiota bacterium]|jgi:hypothetical protein|nr:hypothetical protein [Elusimicrobiota bacterium]
MTAIDGIISRREGNKIYLRHQKDFEAVLQESSAGGHKTYTLIDYAAYDKDGKEIKRAAPSPLRGTSPDGGRETASAWPQGLKEREGGPKISKNLDKLEAIEITEKLPRFKKVEDLRNWILAKLEGIKEITVKETNQSIQISKSGVKRSLKRGRDNLTNQSYSETKELLESAKYLGFKEADARHEGKVEGQDIFAARMNIKGEDGNSYNYDVIFQADVLNNDKLNYAGQKVIPASDTDFKPLLNGDNNSIADGEQKVNSEIEIMEIRKAAYTATQEALNPYLGDIYDLFSYFSKISRMLVFVITQSYYLS